VLLNADGVKAKNENGPQSGPWSMLEQCALASERRVQQYGFCPEMKFVVANSI